jgi:hypothetical protein
MSCALVPQRIQRVCLLLAFGSLPLSMFAAPSCRETDFIGVYGMQAVGTITAFPGLNGPFARVGSLIADGRGNVSVANTASYNGNLITESYSGTYRVGDDCSISMVMTVPVSLGGALVPVPFEFAGYLAEAGSNVRAVLCGVGAPCFVQPTGSVIRLQLERYAERRNACSSRNLAGAYQTDLSGHQVSGPAPGPVARVGRLEFDGAGAFDGFAISDLAGATATREPISGSYSVDDLCNVTIRYSQGGPHEWTGVLTNNGAGAELIVSESGVVIAGTLRKQLPGRN